MKMKLFKMRNQTFFIFVFSAISVQFPGCHTLSSREEWEIDQRKRIADDLKLVQNVKEKEAVINWLVAERWDHKKTNDKKIEAERDKMEYAALPTVQCQMEYLEQTLFPYDIYRNPGSRFLRWMIIMTTPGDDRELFTKAVLSEYREAYPDKNDQELKELYASVMQDVYNDMSSVPKSFHSNIDAEVLHYINEKFSKALSATNDCIEDKAKVRWYITLFGLKYEQRYVRAIKIVSADRNFTGRQSLKSGSKAISDARELSCILIMPEERKDTFPSGVTENDVNDFFPPTNRPRKVKIDLGKDRKVKPEPIKTKDGKTLQLDWADKIIAEFKDYQIAKDAFDERQRWMKGQKVQVLPVACKNGDGFTSDSPGSKGPAEGSVAA